MMSFAQSVNGLDQPHLAQQIPALVISNFFAISASPGEAFSSRAEPCSIWLNKVRPLTFWATRIQRPSFA